MSKDSAKKIIIVGVGELDKISNHLLIAAKKHDIAIVSTEKREDISPEMLKRFCDSEVELIDIDEAKEQGIETERFMHTKDVEIILPFEMNCISEPYIPELSKAKKHPKQYVPKTIGKVNNKPLNRNNGRR